MHSIGKFNVDNASNNDTALVEISRRIQEKGYPSFDPVTDRLRCSGHVTCRLGDDAINALECLKSWQRDGVIPATKEDIKEMEEMLCALCEVELR
jgi:hypothetical protein